MGLIGKLVLGKTAVDLVGKKVKKAEKKVKKNVKRTKRTIFLLMLAFTAGACLTGWFVFRHRETLAAAVNRRTLAKRRHKCCCGKKLLKNLIRRLKK